jgi:hypothetical protein
LCLRTLRSALGDNIQLTWYAAADKFAGQINGELRATGKDPWREDNYREYMNAALAALDQIA